MTAAFGESQPSDSAAGRHRAPHDAPTGSMGAIPADRRSRNAHGGSSRGPCSTVPAPLSRAARTAGLSLAAIGALAGAGGVATGNLAAGDEPATTGEFALPTNLAAADMAITPVAKDVTLPAVANVAAPAVMPAVAPVATVSPALSKSPEIKTSSPAGRAAAADKAKTAKADADAKAAKEASSSAGAQAVAAAKQEIGVPYEWGGTSPSGFDCSGLMQWAYEKAGKDLPRSSSAQSQEGEKVSMDDLQPGDMVFMYSPVSHVGMYAGNGQIIEAPTEGEDVKMTPISKYSDEIVGARRV